MDNTIERNNPETFLDALFQNKFHGSILIFEFSVLANLIRQRIVLHSLSNNTAYFQILPLTPFWFKARSGCRNFALELYELFWRFNEFDNCERREWQ